MKVSAKGGIIKGPSHAQGGVKFFVDGKIVETEGGELVIPVEIFNDKKRYSFSGTNIQVVNSILKKFGAKTINQAVTVLEAQDYVVCKVSAKDEKIYTYSGSLQNIVKKINASGGCSPVAKEEPEEMKTKSCGCKHPGAGISELMEKHPEAVMLAEGGSVPGSPKFNMGDKFTTLEECEIEIIEVIPSPHYPHMTGYIFHSNPVNRIWHNTVEYEGELERLISEQEITPIYVEKMEEGGPVSGKTDSPILDELNKAKSDLSKAEHFQDLMKKANTVIRSKKDVTKKLVELGISEENASKLQTPDFAKRIGFPQYKLTNNNANIKRLQSRVSMLETKWKATRTNKEEKYSFADGMIEVNYDLDRVQIFFNGKPNEEVRKKLKSNGWHWSPSNTAWQRKITPQAISNARYLLNAKAVDVEKSDEAKEEVQKTFAIQDIDDRNFSYVSISAYDAIKLPQELDHKSPRLNCILVVFTPVGADAKDMVKKYITENLRELNVEKLKINVYPKTYVREAKELFVIGKYLPNDISPAKILFPLYDLVKELEFFSDNLSEDSPIVLHKKPVFIPEEKAERAIIESPVSKSQIYRGTSAVYKNQYELNKAIEELIDRNGSDYSNSYSSDEKLFLKKYSGYGGLDKFGPTGKGGLFEYYTPREVIEKMWALAYKYGYNNGSICETSVGTGEFLQFAKPESRIVGFEINPYSAKICKILYPTAEIHEQPFEKHFIKNNFSIKRHTDELEKFDLVIGNPPYGDFSIVESRYMSGMGERDYTQARNYVEYFLHRGIDLLKPNGLLVFIIGAQLKNGGTMFLDSGITPVKEYLSHNTQLLDAYRLPDTIFERTGVTSDIIVLIKS